MKPIYQTICCTALGLSLLASCADFDEVNSDPLAANESQAKVEYAINNAITGAQQDPHIGERIFALTWMATSRMGDPNFLSSITLNRYNDGWNSDYYRYISEWLSSANLAVSLADGKLKENISDKQKEQINNMKQVARIWRVYLMSEFVDNFGAMPIKAFEGKNPEFNSCQEVYYYMLSELKDAATTLKPEVAPEAGSADFDRVYKFDFAKWRKYAVSMRMRLAMRLSEVDASKAKAEFEDAVKSDYISELSDNFAVKERDGWDPLTGVLTRQWDDFAISATANNLMVGLGGVTSDEQLAGNSELLGSIKPENYMGVRYEKHFSLKTNDPAKGFWFDGLHKVIDPRAYSLFSIPGNFNDGDYTKYPTWNENWKTLERKLYTDKAKSDSIKLNAKYAWQASATGRWGELEAINEMCIWPYAMPGLKLRFRNSTNARIFFAAWESYFLMAEAAVRGWAVPLSAKAAYEKGIKLSFDYHNLGQFVSAYLASEDYNNVGTSVKWEHTADAPSTKAMTMVNGYTKANESYTYHYPEASKTLYGKSLNDALSKIITQKYIANMPWLPLEAWNDQRRLGLPFFETPVAEEAITTMPALTGSNYEEQKIDFFPQRLKFPSSFEQSSPSGYSQAVKLLGGADAVSTPLWWAKKK